MLRLLSDLWPAAVVGVLLAGVGMALLWPHRLLLRYRKPWQGRLAWICLYRGWGGWTWRGSHRGWRWRWGSLHVQGRWPPRLGSSFAAADGFRYWPHWWAVGRQLHIQSWQGGVELGLADPALTGQCLGLIAALPPSLAQHLRLSFTHIGWRGRGSLVIRFRGWQVLGPVLRLGWVALRKHLRKH